jgi:hypothetical protein
MARTAMISKDLKHTAAALATQFKEVGATLPTRGLRLHLPQPFGWGLAHL